MPTEASPRDVVIISSVPSAGAVAAEVSSAFSVGKIGSCVLIGRDQIPTYLLSTSDNRYIATVSDRNAGEGDSECYEGRFLEHLHERCVPVPPPVRSRAGELAIPMPCPEGPRSLQLFRYVAGVPLSWRDKEHCHEAGKLVARMHCAAEDFPGVGRLHIHELMDLVNESRARIHAALQDKAEEQQYLDTFVSRLLAGLGSGRFGDLRGGPGHGQVSNSRSFRICDDRMWLLNFAHCGPGLRMIDVAAINDVAARYQDESIREAFLSGYSDIRGLQASELAAIPCFEIISRLRKFAGDVELSHSCGALTIKDKKLAYELKALKKFEESHLGRISASTSTARKSRSLIGRTEAPQRPMIAAERGVAGCVETVRSVVCPEVVARQFERTYAIDGVRNCRLLLAGINDTYIVITEDCRYIGRLYRAGLRSLDEIMFELELLIYLDAGGQSVALPIKDRAGSYVQRLDVPEGCRFLVFFAFADGTRLRWNPEDARVAGCALASFHVRSERFECAVDRPQPALDVASASADVAACIADPDDLAAFQQLSLRLSEYLERVDNHRLEWGVCHGDLTCKNIHKNSNNQAFILDFDYCGFGWRAIDFIPMRKASIGFARTDLWDAFLDGYQEVREISDRDKAAAPYFEAIVRIWRLALAVNRMSFDGTELLRNHHLTQELKYLFDFERRYLEW